jgi:hypothetical protein
VTAEAFWAREREMGRQDMSWGTPRFTTLVENVTPHNRLNIAVIGDGYTAAEQDLYQSHVDPVIEAFRRTALNTFLEPQGGFYVNVPL